MQISTNKQISIEFMHGFEMEENARLRIIHNLCNFFAN